MESITDCTDSSGNASNMTLHSVSSRSDEESSKCPICLEKMSNVSTEESVESLACGHIFHSVCLQTWLQISNTCPICRTPAYVTEENIIDLISPDEFERIFQQNEDETILMVPTPYGTWYIQMHPRMRRHILVSLMERRRMQNPRPRRGRFRRFMSSIFSCFR